MVSGLHDYIEIKQPNTYLHWQGWLPAMGKKAPTAGNLKEEVACGCNNENKMARGEEDDDDDYGED